MSLGPRRSALVVAIAVGLAGIARAQAPGAGAPPPPAVVVETIEVQEVSDPAEFTARVEAISAVDIRAQVDGLLETVDFGAGERVDAGDLLFEIEPDRYEAAVASARARVARAEAARQKAAQDLARIERLFERGTVAEATLDETKAALKIAEAEVAVAEAALRAAELDLENTRIVAPISGQIGRALFTRGALVGPQSGPLARIVQVDPVRVVFPVPEGLIVTLRQRARAGGGVDPDAVRLTLRLPNGTLYRETGSIEYVESEVNPQTGTVAVRAVFPNPDRLLIPNQFVTLVAEEENAPTLPVVPQTAVLQDREGRFVYLLGEGDTVTKRRIETGARVGNGWAVTEGLSGGEQVVVQGVQRLGDGMVVQPVAAAAPAE